MIRSFLVLFGCLLFSTAFAQSQKAGYDYVLGPLFKVSKKEVPIEFIGADKEGFYVYYERVNLTAEGRRSVKKFSYELKPVEEVLLYEGSFSRYDSYAAFMLGNDLFHLSLNYSKARSGVPEVVKEATIYLQSIDRSDLSLGKREQLTPLLAEGESVANIRVLFSQDRSLFAIVYSITDKGKEKDRMGVHVLRTDTRQVLWEDRLVLPYSDKLLAVADFLLGDDGEIFVLGKRFRGRRGDQRWGQVNYDFMLFEFEQRQLIDSIKFEAGARFLRDLYMQFAPNGDLLAGGIYSNKGVNTTDGVFFIKLDGSTRAVLKSSFEAFDLEILSSNLTERQAKKVEKKAARGEDLELPYYYINQFTTGPEGSLTMIAEQRQVSYTTNYNPAMNAGGQYIQTINYYYRDIIIVTINGDGDIDWIEKVAKDQFSQNDGGIFSSFATATVADDVYLIYNDHLGNLNYTGTGRVARMSPRSSRTHIVLNRLMPDGATRRSPFLSAKETETMIRPALTMQVTDDEVLLFGHKKLKNQRFILLKLSN